MLLDSLSRLESQLHRAEHLRRSLRPGLSPDQIERRARALPFALPPEVRALYAWRDGSRGNAPDFVAYYRFLSLDESLELYREQRKLARDVAGADADRLWSPRWLPIFQMDGQQFLVIVGDGEATAAPLYRMFIQSPMLLQQFASIAELVDHVAACIERGGYTYDNAGRLDEHREIVAAVRRERGGGRVDELIERIRGFPAPEELLRLGSELEELRDPRFVDELLQSLDSVDSTFELQVAVAKVLGPLQDARAVEPLMAKLNGAHPRLASAIVSALMWLGDSRAERPIREILETTRNQELRQQAIIALGALGGDESVRLLESLLDGELSLSERTAVLTALQRRGIGNYAPPGPADFAPGGALRAQLEREIAEERDPLVRAARESALRFMEHFPHRTSWPTRLRHLFLRALLSLVQRGRS